MSLEMPLPPSMTPRAVRGGNRLPLSIRGQVRQAAIRLYRDRGLSSGRVAHRLTLQYRCRVSQTTVARWIREAGLTRDRSEAVSRGRQGRVWQHRARIERAQILYNRGHRTVPEIARELEVCVGTVYRWLNLVGAVRSRRAAQQLRRQRLARLDVPVP